MRATTTAMVRDLNVTFDDAVLAVQGYYAASGLRPEDFSRGAEFAELVAETVAGMAEIAVSPPVGSVVGRRLDQLIWRREASGLGEH